MHDNVFLCNRNAQRELDSVQEDYDAAVNTLENAQNDLNNEKAKFDSADRTFKDLQQNSCPAACSSRKRELPSQIETSSFCQIFKLYVPVMSCDYRHSESYNEKRLYIKGVLYIPNVIFSARTYLQY